MSSEENLHRDLYRTVGGVFARQIYTSIVGLATAIICARVLGPEGNGLYATAMLLPTVTFALLNLGIAYSTVYMLNSGRADIAAVYKTFIHVCGWASMAILPIGLGIWLFGRIAFNEIPEPMLYTALLVYPLLLLNSGYLALLQAREDFSGYNIIYGLIPTISLLVVFVTIVFLRIGAIGPILGVLAGNLVGIGFAHLRVRPLLHQKCPCGRRTREFMSYGARSGAADAMQFINYRADLYFVNLFLGVNDAGLYALAINLCERLWMVADAFTAVLFPRFTKLGHAAESIFLKSAALVAVLAMALAIVMGVAMHILIGPIFGKAFARATIAADWLLPGIAMIAVGKVFTSFLASKGRMLWNVAVSLTGTVVNITCNLRLTPHYGIRGAAISTSLGYIVITVGAGLFCLYQLQTARRAAQLLPADRP